MSERAGESVRLRIGTVAVTAASAVEARRLADALPAALERAWRAADPAPSRNRPTRGRRTADAADAVADEVVRAARRALDRRAGTAGDPGEGGP